MSCLQQLYVIIAFKTLPWFCIFAETPCLPSGLFLAHICLVPPHRFDSPHVPDKALCSEFVLLLVVGDISK